MKSQIEISNKTKRKKKKLKKINKQTPLEKPSSLANVNSWYINVVINFQKKQKRKTSQIFKERQING